MSSCGSLSTGTFSFFPCTLPAIYHPPQALPPDFDTLLARLHADRDSSSQSPDHRLQWACQALDYVDVVTAHAARSYPAHTPASSHASMEAEAVAIVEHFANQGTPRALYCKATWFEFGRFGQSQDRKAAFQLYKSAAQAGFARAEYRLGVQYEKADDMRRAIQIYNRAASKNDCAANYRLGMMTILGQHGHKQDFAKGISRLHVAATTADQDAPQGCYVFGLLLAKDLPGVQIPDEFLRKDIRAAVTMLEKASNLGFGPALLKLGNIYEFGNYDEPFDPAVSLYYYTLAAIRGEVEADMALSKWYLCGSEGVFEKNEELAFVHALRAAGRGNATAEFALGYFYEVGIHVSPDFEKAQVYYG
ncbi:Chitin synthase regulatory factor 4, partial [Neolecta irregularis DAH-3]